MSDHATTYDTLADALADGWRKPTNRDQDVSGDGSFGYDFQALDGSRSVKVRFREDRNAMGNKGCVRPLLRTYAPA